jgi:DNA repair protein RadC
MAYLREVELRYRISEIEGGVVGEDAGSSARVFELFSDLQNEAKEKFITINLDTHDKIICFEVVAIGSFSAIYVRPMEAFRSCFALNAASAIVVHNHPSGDPQPSQADIDFTRKLVTLSEDMGMRLWDHVIIGTGRYFSFADSGLLGGMRSGARP